MRKEGGITSKVQQYDMVNCMVLHQKCSGMVNCMVLHHTCSELYGMLVWAVCV